MNSKAPPRSRRLGQKADRGFAQLGTMLETLGATGAMLMLVLGAQYVNDTVRARRAAEDTAAAVSAGEAVGFCERRAGESAEGVELQVEETGPLPDLGLVRELLLRLGMGQIPTAPIYSRPSHTSVVKATRDPVRAAESLGYTSGVIRADRTLACQERTVEPQGAPWTTLAAARKGLWTRIEGYR
jgi:hypothetical protein